MVYVANTYGGFLGTPGLVSVINGQTNKITANFKLGGSPYGIAVDSLTNKVYVASANKRASWVTVLLASTDQPIRAPVATPRCEPGRARHGDNATHSGRCLNRCGAGRADPNGPVLRSDGSPLGSQPRPPDSLSGVQPLTPKFSIRGCGHAALIAACHARPEGSR